MAGTANLGRVVGPPGAAGVVQSVVGGSNVQITGTQANPIVNVPNPGDGDMKTADYGGSNVNTVRNADRLGGVEASGYATVAALATKADKGPIGGKLLFEGSVSIGGTGVAPGLSSYSTIAVGTSATSSSWGESFQPAGSPVRGNAFYCAGSLMNVAAWTLTVSGDNFTVTRLQSINLGPSGAVGWDGTTGAITRIYGIETQ